jgi:hypothetical protein
MNQDIQSLLKELVTLQYDNALKLIECAERLFALEAALIALDQRTMPIMNKVRAEAHDRNQMPREQIQKQLAMIQSLLGQIGQKPPN